MIKIEIVKDMLYLCNNEKGKYYLQCIFIYPSGKHFSNIMFLHEDIYRIFFDELKDKYNIIKY